MRTRLRSKIPAGSRAATRHRPHNRNYSEHHIGTSCGGVGRPVQQGCPACGTDFNDPSWRNLVARKQHKPRTQTLLRSWGEELKWVFRDGYDGEVGNRPRPARSRHSEVLAADDRFWSQNGLELSLEAHFEVKYLDA